MFTTTTHGMDMLSGTRPLKEKREAGIRNLSREVGPEHSSYAEGDWEAMKQIEPEPATGCAIIFYHLHHFRTSSCARIDVRLLVALLVAVHSDHQESNRSHDHSFVFFPNLSCSFRCEEVPASVGCLERRAEYLVLLTNWEWRLQSINVIND